MDAPGVDARLAGLYEAKARAELAEAFALAREAAGPALPAFRGRPAAAVLLVKGIAGPEDAAAGRALAGADWDAARKALGALGLPADDLLGVVTRTGPEEGGKPNAGAVGRGFGDLVWLRQVVEACDPGWVIALDEAAAADVARAAGLERLALGRPQGSAGRVWLAVDGLEESLSDPVRKRRVWAQLKKLGKTWPRGVDRPDVSAK